MGEIKARGGDIETVEGEVVAGDAGDVDVVSLKGKVQLIFGNINYTKHNYTKSLICYISLTHLIFSESKTQSRSACPPCKSGTFCCKTSHTCVHVEDHVEACLDWSRNINISWYFKLDWFIFKIIAI